MRLQLRLGIILCVLLGVLLSGILVAGNGSSAVYGAPPLQVTPTPLPDTGTPPGTDTAAIVSGTYEQTILSAGLVRRYYVHIPTGYTGNLPLPLLITYHGFTDDPQNHEQYTGFSDLADEEGFIVVYPEGVTDPKGWFAHDDAEEEYPDDVQFTRDLIKTLVHTYAIDTTRIYISGFSNGGGMAHRIACDLGDIVAAVSMVGGTHIDEDPCQPTRPMPILAMHGIDDNVTPYLGTTGLLESIPEWAQEWAAYDQCNPEPLVTTPQESVTLETWTGCEGDGVVLLYSYERLGHSWPFRASQIIWKFLSYYQISAEQAEVAQASLSTDINEPGAYRVSLLSSGEVRSYLLYVPNGYQPDMPMPVVISFHDYASSPVAYLQQSTLYLKADEAGFLLVLPQGRGEPLSWLTESEAPAGVGTDTNFFLAMVLRLDIDLNIDLTRIYVTGFSLGGDMAHRVACDHADLVAGIAIINGAHWTGQTCTPSQPVPIFALHTLDNDIIPMEGIAPEIDSVMGWAQTWVTANGCTGEPVTDEEGVTHWADCQTPLELVLLETGGHEWVANASDLLWAFFSEE